MCEITHILPNLRDAEAMKQGEWSFSRVLIPCDVIDFTMKSMKDMKKRYRGVLYARLYL
jgi:hypothetical protein